MFRLFYAAACLLLAGFAGILYYEQTQVTAVLVAMHDLPVGAQIGDADVSLRQVAAAAVPAGVLSQADQAVGEFMTFPVMAGQFLMPRHVSRTRAGTAITNGLPVPPGYRILSLPVGPAAAVGGALSAGDLVDVVAVPDVAKGSPGAMFDPAGNTLLGQRVLVLGLRTDQGTGLDADPRNASPGPSKLGSVLLAIPASDEQRYAAAIAADTFVLTLVAG
jgi:Flp pilus assembly protein CpaB